MNIDERPKDVCSKETCKVCGWHCSQSKMFNLFVSWLSQEILLQGLKPVHHFVILFFFPTNRIKPSNCTSYTCPICCSWKFPFLPGTTVLHRHPWGGKWFFRFYLPGITIDFLETRIFKGNKKKLKIKKENRLDVPLEQRKCWMCPFCCREMSSQVWRSTGSCSELGSRGGSFEGQGIEIDPKGGYRNPWHFSDWVP